VVVVVTFATGVVGLVVGVAVALPAFCVPVVVTGIVVPSGVAIIGSDEISTDPFGAVVVPRLMTAPFL